ncbi:hypothetical protein Golob_024628, partial [Gossypium lobatum]|nr:hypothetical protein [Gossypium lobatum]
ESLSETLTLFYPLAGRIKDHLSIDCNDEGAYYVEARVNRPLRELLNLTDSPYVSQLLPAEPTWTATTAGGYIAMIQVTTFACGGIAIGAFLSHVIADGPAATKFISSWAALTRKCGEEAPCPNFDASRLPTECGIPQGGDPFSTVQPVVSALLSKCIKATFKAKSDIQKSTLITHTVNLRQRARPQIPNHSMGNFLCLAAALVTAKETELDNLVCHLRKEIRKIDADLITALQGDGGLLKYCEYMKEIGKGTNDNIDIILFSSWCNFGLYEIDFGWGKPTWVTCATESKSEIGMVNTIVLMDTKMGNGVEASTGVLGGAAHGYARAKPGATCVWHLGSESIKFENGLICLRWYIHKTKQ